MEPVQFTIGQCGALLHPETSESRMTERVHGSSNPGSHPRSDPLTL